MLIANQKTTGDVKGIARCHKPTEKFHPTLQLPSDLQTNIASFIVLVLSQILASSSPDTHTEYYLLNTKSYQLAGEYSEFSSHRARYVRQELVETENRAKRY